ncbi:spermine oxidase-like [Chrysoperla carnea]|uniref:spermine oxidase-like n=1 Tax=Chrysoperla carnea TaxID=189513 RepID=UPI001D08D97D|nr:spermine oxidase-like [Chrysoperla carnea]XP_044740337.1 spermine oxidase-like [Chrysoperla carnea]XP_044740338.1 spermine oxidase-like [Chrysoperla carnea]XP_044740339.1 spermine oxidase-like [Chrysoperla carnea]
MTGPSVIIIGTGASGLAVGTKLYENGFKNILWLEANNRIGGRIYTENFGENVIDYGAQWCHGEKDNCVYKLAQPYNLLESSNFNFTDPQQFPEFFTVTGSNLPHDDTFKVHLALFEIMHTSENEMINFKDSLGHFVDIKFQEKLKSDLIGIDKNISKYVYDWFHKVENSLEASDTWYQTSARGLTEYWECEGDLLLNWKTRGYRTILDLLMKKYPDPTKALPLDDKILLNKEVTNIVWNTDSNQNGVKVKCTDGSEYKADHVIVTVSLGVLKERINSLFKPELPLTKLRAIRGLNIGTVNKLIFEFPHRWWPENHTGFSFVWNGDEVKETLKEFDGSLDDNTWLGDVFGFYPINHQPNVLLGWVVSSGARKMEEIPEDEVKTKLIQLLRKFLGKKFNIPEPVAFTRSKWYTNPYFRGSYTFRSMATEKLNTSAADLAQPLKNSTGKEVVLFAGEATHSHYYSTVHGAIETGWREADRLLKLYMAGLNEITSKI